MPTPSRVTAGGAPAVPWLRPMAAAVALALCAAAPAPGQVRVVNYNIAHLGGDQAALDGVLQALAGDDRPGFAVPASVIVLQEVAQSNLAVLASLIADAAPGVSYSTATYTNFGEDAFGGAQALFYRSDLLIEVAAAHADIFTGAGRWSDRWRLRLVGYDSPDAGFYIYSTHLKAGSSASDEADRLAGAMAIRDDVEGLPAGSHVIVCGDMNLSDNMEPAYLEFISARSGQLVDPLGTGTWSGSANAIKHTQSPRDTTAGGLAGGGMDDRFDLQLSTAPMHDDDGLSMIPGTYRAVGNDGNHFDVAINDGTNTYFPGDVPRSNALADDLHDASDHVPVAADYQVPPVMSAFALPLDHATVIEGAALTTTILVQNQAGVDVAIGGDVLDFTVATTGDVTGGGAGAALPLGPFVTVDVGVDTSAAGPRSGTAVVTAVPQGTQNPVRTFVITASVLRHANASFDRAVDIDAIEIALDVPAGSGVHAIDVAVHNLGYDALQATLDVDDVEPVAAPFAFDGVLPSGIAGDPAILGFSVDATGQSDVVLQEIVEILVSDADLPGETSSALMLTMTVTVGGAGRDCPADLNDDGAVDVTDLLQLLGAWGICAGCPEDLDMSGAVDVTDLLELLAAWGSCP